MEKGEEGLGQFESLIKYMRDSCARGKPVIIFIDECEGFPRRAGVGSDGGSDEDVADLLLQDYFLKETGSEYSDSSGFHGLFLFATNRVSLVNPAVLSRSLPIE